MQDAKEVVISFDEETGGTSFVHDSEVSQAMELVGTLDKNRATHVEPVNALARSIFYLIRNRVDDSSWLANLTRLFPCKWQARLISTNEIIGVGRDRKDVIRQEVEYLNERI